MHENCTLNLFQNAHALVFVTSTENTQKIIKDSLILKNSCGIQTNDANMIYTTMPTIKYTINWVKQYMEDTN